MHNRLPGILGFVESRVRRNTMRHEALGRIVRAVSGLSLEERGRLGVGPSECAPSTGKLRLKPVPLAVANAFVLAHHRHHGPVVGHKFSLGVFDELGLRGVAIAGRPVSRHMDDGASLEVTRVATDGTRNACSKLYAGVARHASKSGFQRVLTYTLAEENGASLRASNWKPVFASQGGSWNVPSRPRRDKSPTSPKTRWEASV